MKKYKHKKLGWIAEPRVGYLQYSVATTEGEHQGYVPKEIIEDSQDRELIEEKDILVPDCIKISPSDLNYSMGIIKGNQELFYDYDCKVYGINTNHKLFNKIKCKLVKVNPEDRETGKIYYASGFDIEDIKFYHIYLGAGYYVYLEYNNGFYEATISNYNYSELYKVVPFN